MTRAEDPAPRAVKVLADAYGDPLPEGAVARLGTRRLQPGGRISRLSFSPDGRQLASASETGLSIWDAATGKELRHVPLAERAVRALAWPAAGQGVAAVLLGDRSVYLWNFADERAIPPPAGDRPASGGAVSKMDGDEFRQYAVSPDGRRLAVGRAGYQDGPRPIDVKELVPGKKVGELKVLRTLEPQEGSCTGLAWSADGRRLVALSRNSKEKEDRLVVWDPDTGRELKRRTVPTAVEQGSIKVFAVSPDGNSLALGCADGTVQILEWAGDAAPRAYSKHASERVNGTSASAVAFAPDGRALVTAGWDRVVRAWDPADGKDLRTLDAKTEDRVEALAFSPDGGRVATAGQGGAMRIWDVRTGADACPLAGHRSLMVAASVAPDGKTVASVGTDETVRLWGPATGRERWRNETGVWPFVCQFSGDGKLLLVGHLREGPRGYDSLTGEPVRLPGELAATADTCHGFSTDGRTLITSGRGTVTLWDWPAGRKRRTVELTAAPHKPEDLVCSAASLSPDGRVLAGTVYRYTRHFRE